MKILIRTFLLFCIVTISSSALPQNLHTKDTPINDRSMPHRMREHQQRTLFPDRLMKSKSLVGRSFEEHLTSLLNKTNINTQYARRSLSDSVKSAWTSLYGSNLVFATYDNIEAIAIDGSGNIYVTGYNADLVADAVTVKYNALGIVQWVARYTRSENSYEYVDDIVVDRFGNAYVKCIGSPIIKYNSSGVEQWAVFDSLDRTTALAVDSSGNVYITGYRAWSLSDTGPLDGYSRTIKYNSSGIQQWSTQRNGYFGQALDLDAAGNVYITESRMRTKNYNDTVYVTTKYNSAGAVQWIAGYIARSGWLTSLVVDISGNIYIAGKSADSTGFSGFTTIKYNPNGLQQWVARHPGGSEYALAVDDSKNVYVASGGGGNPLPDTSGYEVIKYDSSGTEQWVSWYRTEYGTVSSIKVDSLSNVYVTGSLGTVKYNSNGSRQWVDSSGYARNIVLDKSGNVFVAKLVVSDSTGTDYSVVKYNTSGVQQWLSRYNSPPYSNNHAECLATDGSGNIYVTGTSHTGSGGGGFATVKYNDSGIQQWDALYNGHSSNGTFPTAIAVDVSQNVYVTGWSESSTRYFVTVKYDLSGVQQWVAHYNYDPIYDGDDRPSAVAIDKVGNVYVTGAFGLGDNPSYGTIKYNSSGVEQWVARYRGLNNSASASALAVDLSGNVYVAGNAGTVKYNSSGIQQWTSPIMSSGLVLDKAGSLYVAGTMDTSYATIKFDSSGTQQWIAQYKGSENCYAKALALDALGNIYVTGEAGRFLGSGMGFPSLNFVGDSTLTIKYSPNGTLQWVATHPGVGASGIVLDAAGNCYVNGNEIINYSSLGVEERMDQGAVAIGIDPSNNFYAARSAKTPGGIVFATTKYLQTPATVEAKRPATPTTYRLEQNYPNPFNPTTVISYQLPVASHVSLKVFDLLGREVVTLVNEERSAGSHNVQWNAEGFSNGVYLVTINSGRFSETKKVVLMK